MSISHINHCSQQIEQDEGIKCEWQEEGKSVSLGSIKKITRRTYFKSIRGTATLGNSKIKFLIYMCTRRPGRHKQRLSRNTCTSIRTASHGPKAAHSMLNRAMNVALTCSVPRVGIIDADTIRFVLVEQNDRTSTLILRRRNL